MTKNEVKTSVLVDVDDDSMPESSSFNHQHFTKQLQTCRLDRERMALFTKAIQSGNQDKLLEKVLIKHIMALLFILSLFF